MIAIQGFVKCKGRGTFHHLAAFHLPTNPSYSDYSSPSYSLNFHRTLQTELPSSLPLPPSPRLLARAPRVAAQRGQWQQRVFHFRVCVGGER